MEKYEFFGKISNGQSECSTYGARVIQWWWWRPTASLHNYGLSCSFVTPSYSTRRSDTVNMLEYTYMYTDCSKGIREIYTMAAHCVNCIQQKKNTI